MLRASIEASGEAGDLAAVTGGGEISQVAHGEALVRFAEAVLGNDPGELDAARAALLECVGPDGLVDAAAVVGNFKRMVRIADGTGIPLDAPVAMMTQDLHEDLGLARFASSANTPPAGALKRALGRSLGPLLLTALRRLARQRK